MRELQETHCDGLLTIENIQTIIPDHIDLAIANEVGIIGDVSLQISKDGRIWINVNGISFLRFKPTIMQR